MYKQNTFFVAFKNIIHFKILHITPYFSLLLSCKHSNCPFPVPNLFVSVRIYHHNYEIAIDCQFEHCKGADSLINLVPGQSRIVSFFFFVDVVSSPPTTIPPPTTTSLTTTYSTTEWDESDEFNAFGPTHSVVLIDKREFIWEPFANHPYTSTTENHLSSPFVEFLRSFIDIYFAISF